MSPQFLLTYSQVLIFIGVLLGAIGAFGNYYYGNILSKLPILKIEIEKPHLPRWSHSIFLNYTISNQGKGVIRIVSSNIEIIKFNKIMDLKGLQIGAPQVPIQGEVNLEAKLKKYKILYNSDNNFTRLLLKENDMDYITLKVNAIDGIDYLVHLNIEYKFNMEDKIRTFKSKQILLHFPITEL